jgi:hypothetical protein
MNYGSGGLQNIMNPMNQGVSAIEIDNFDYYYKYYFSKTQ